MKCKIEKSYENLKAKFKRLCNELDAMEANLYKTHNELGVIKADKDKLIKYVMMDDKLATYEEVLIAANCSETEGLLEKFQEERREKEKRAEAEKEGK